MYSTSDLNICRTSDGLHCVMWDITVVVVIASARILARPRSGVKRLSSSLRARLHLSFPCFLCCIHIENRSMKS
ncbi:hypothetical protein OUZ56_026167 [Daphnia magna]|uniref:Uncharacterized protein n=1 Tax=Daphnia magna TaxID=35525 RepID=A0ABQ9ZMB4_9CRUS|nr:hypothetical protein OUZ56_026167 [Daphnia magna]